jgi:hypothetical protein
MRRPLATTPQRQCGRRISRSTGTSCAGHEIVGIINHHSKNAFGERPKGLVMDTIKADTVVEFVKGEC